MTTNITRRNFCWRKSISTVVLLSLLMAGFSGCDNRAEGKRLAETGAATGDTLAKYYDSLVQDTVDIWELEAFTASIRELSFDEKQQQLLQDQIDALNRRARLARRLVSTYNALKELTSYDASGEAKASAENLAKAISDVPPLRGSGVDPSGIFGNIAKDILAWKQSKDIRKGNQLILNILEKILHLFEQELDAYKSIAEERGNKFENVIDYLIRNKMVAASPLLQRVPDSLGLKLVASGKPVEKEEAIKGLTELARVRTRRIAIMSAGAGDGIQQALAQMLANQREFQSKKGLSLASVLAGLERAQSYLEEIGKLRGELKN